MSELYENIYKNDRQFSFGENWKSYLEHFSENRLEEAKKNIQKLTGKTSLDGLNFLDIGCGSGLFSMAAYSLGANVTSVDVDQSSVECCKSLRDKLNVEEASWKISLTSVLDEDKISNLDKYDIVYSWGVLHHTGSMWQAIANASTRVSDKGMFIIALYNKTDPLWISKVWLLIKIIYNKSPLFFRKIMIFFYSFFFCLLRFKANIFAFRKYAKDFEQNRGMHYLHDVLDWLGGYPYEVASKEEIENWATEKQFTLNNSFMVSPTESGCNEFVLLKN
jgi:2-polyprenyl-3-methyl-5-hydroxy-6-metoxy-1,4-benzoquinol methylase